MRILNKIKSNKRVILPVTDLRALVNRIDSATNRVYAESVVGFDASKNALKKYSGLLSQPQTATLEFNNNQLVINGEIIVMKEEILNVVEYNNDYVIICPSSTWLLKTAFSLDNYKLMPFIVDKDLVFLTNKVAYFKRENKLIRLENKSVCEAGVNGSWTSRPFGAICVRKVFIKANTPVDVFINNVRVQPNTSINVRGGLFVLRIECSAEGDFEIKDVAVEVER